MKEIQIDYLEKLWATRICGTMSLEEFANAIRTPSDDVRGKVEEVRRWSKGSREYEEHKAALPCFLLNCRTYGSARAEDVREVHPLLFCDIDGVPDDQFNEVRESMLQLLPSTLMVWRSVGGKGMGVLLHVEGHEQNALLDLKEHLCALRFNGFSFDKPCFNVTRKAVHSYDPDIYVNWEAPVFDWTPVIRSNYDEKGAFQSNTHTRELVEEGIGVNDTFSGKPRFDNVSDYFVDEKVTHRFFPDGVSIIKVDSAWVKVGVNRNQWLFRNLVRIKWLNRGISFALLCSLAHKLNKKAMATPMNTEEVRKIATNVFRNSYKPTGGEKRKVLFNPAAKLSPREKQVLTAQLMGAARTSETKQVIHEAITSYMGDRRITAKLVSEITGLGISCVKRKWSDFKELVKELNAARKANSEQGAIKSIGAGVLRNSTSFRSSSNSGPLRAAA